MTDASAAPVRFVYDRALASYQLSADHPFKPERLELTRSLLEAAGLLRQEHLAAPDPLSEKALLRVHDPRYVEAVKAASRAGAGEDGYPFGLGTGDNPVFRGMHEAVLAVCGATVTAVDLVASGRARRAASFAGGLHHALRAKASGFCVYNDLAVGIRHAVDGHGLRVAYVDLDAHHGDGVQWIFYDTPDVMTISLHESGRYLFPGTGNTFETGRGSGRGTAVNLPLEPFTEDASFLEVFDAVVPGALRAFAPDLLVFQAGADMHRRDPLADLSLTLRGMEAAYRRVVALADDLCEGRLVATGGGGYDPYRTVPRAWSHLWAAMTGRHLPDPLPRAWRDAWRGRVPEALPATAYDEEDAPPIPRRDAIASHNRAMAARLNDTLAGIWRQRAVAEPGPGEDA